MFHSKPHQQRHHHAHRHNNNFHHSQDIIHHDPFASLFDNRINIMMTPPPPPGGLFASHELAAANPLGAANTRMDWHETPHAHVLKAHLPGFRKDEVRLEVEEEEEGHGHALRLTCEKKVETEEKADGWYRVARSSGRVLQRLTLPENSDPHHMAAAMENGVLTLTIPKKQLQPYY
ncbi:unnamed protein product [Linum trigynum]|uniref:SHSP domain-containing protein n=1 Tax=Linum trigynum TaxID=586398 RepID=A0AAV2DZ55_9ROSI